MFAQVLNDCRCRHGGFVAEIFRRQIDTCMNCSLVKASAFMLPASGDRPQNMKPEYSVGSTELIDGGYNNIDTSSVILTKTSDFIGERCSKRGRHSRSDFALRDKCVEYRQ
jgi:hypothetical protein